MSSPQVTPPPTVLVASRILQSKVDLGRIATIWPGAAVLTEPFGQRQFDAQVRAPGDASAAPLTPAQRRAFASADVLVTLHAPLDLRSAAPRLRWMHCLGSGVEHLRPVRLDHVTLTNSAGSNSVAIAEWVLARVLEDYKRLPEHAEAQRGGRWQAAPGRVLAGRTAAVLGFGAIGRATARRLHAFDVRVLAVRRSRAPGAVDPDADEVHGPAQLEEVLGRADVVVVCAPDTAETRGLIDGRRLAAMRPGAMLLNVSRGSLVDEDALTAALVSGRLRAAAIDVTASEPLPPDSPLWSVPNLRISPHSSSNYHAGYVAAFEIFCANLTRLRAGERLLNVVDQRVLLGSPRG